MSLLQDNQIWRIVGASELGSTHKRSGLPNQDAFGWLPTTSIGSSIIMAVSDGHGSAKSFRSDIGAKVAVSTTLEILNAFLISLPKELIWEDLTKRIQQELPINIVKAWNQAVTEDLSKNPFSTTELDRMVNQDGASAQEILKKNNFLAYGATLLAVVATDKFMLFMQLGDGDILVVDALAEASRIFERDARLIGNETTSLCMPNAEREFKIKVLQPQEFPTLVLISTDGYNNSFPIDEGFMKIGHDYFQMIRNYGLDEVASLLPEYLNNTSKNGSGDDITLVILKRDECIGVDFGMRQEIKIKELSEKLNQTITRSEFEQASANEAKVIHEKIGDIQTELQDSVTNLLQTSEKVLVLESGLHSINGELINIEDSLRNFQSMVIDADQQIETRLESAINYLDDRLRTSISNEQEMRTNAEQAIQNHIGDLQKEKEEILDRMVDLEGNLRKIDGNLNEFITRIDQTIQSISNSQTTQDRHVRWLQRGTALAVFLILVTLLVVIIYAIGKI